MGSQLAKNLVTETVTVNPETPWLDVHGRELPDEVLKNQLKSWSEKNWAEYMETIETPMRETLVSEKVFNCVLDKQCDNIFLNAQASCPEGLKATIERCVFQLSKRQQQIVHMIFWKNLSEREIGRALGVTRPTVQVNKKRALRQLENLILSESRPTKLLESLPDVVFSKLKGA